MAEAVDRLQLVADDDQLAARPAQRLDQPQLQAVGVLELVDQQVAEAAAVGLADLGPLEQPGGEDLQVLEVDPGAALLGRLEAGREELQQLGQVAVGLAALAGLGACGRSPPRSPRGRGRSPSPCCRCAAPAARRGPAAARARPAAPAPARPARAWGRSRFSSSSACPGRLDRRGDRLRRVARRRLRQPRLAPRRGCAARRGRRRRSPAARRCRRPRPSPRAPPRRRRGTRPALRRRPRGRPASASGASRTRKPGSIPAATGWPASSRLQKPWIVVTQAPPIAAQQLRRPLGARLGPPRQLGADPLAQLGRGLVGEGEGEDRVGGDALVADEAAVAVDHHPGLAGAGAGLEQDVAAADLDRRRLLGGRRARRSSLLHVLVLLVLRGAVAAADRREVAEGGADVVAAQAARAGRGRGGCRRRACGRRSRRRAAARPPAAPRAPRRRPRRGRRGRSRRGPRPPPRRRRRAGAAPRSRAAGGRGRRPAPRPSARRPRAGRAAAAASPAPRTSRAA